MYRASVHDRDGASLLAIGSVAPELRQRVEGPRRAPIHYRFVVKWHLILILAVTIIIELHLVIGIVVGDLHALYGVKRAILLNFVRDGHLRRTEPCTHALWTLLRFVIDIGFRSVCWREGHQVILFLLTLLNVFTCGSLWTNIRVPCHFLRLEVPINLHRHGLSADLIGFITDCWYLRFCVVSLHWFS